MAITPNYSWPIPDDTDLVKDGAEARRDLGNAIDTTVDGLGIGLVHIETRTVTASSAESFNNVFNSTYQNYRIVGSLVGSLTDNLNIRFRVGGTDNSSSVYQRQRLGATGTNVTATRATDLSSARLGVTSTNGSIFSIDVYNPNLSAKTSLFANFAPNIDTNVDIEVTVNTHNSTTVFDGFTLLPVTGNITGTIRIYGYQN